MRASPDRGRLLAAARRLFPDMLRLTPNVDDLHLFGGVDVAATLSSGRVVRSAGVLSRPRVICLAMAERCPPDLAAKLAQHLDAFPDALLLALDEGAEDTERLPDLLAERLAFFIAPDTHCPEHFCNDPLPALPGAAFFRSGHRHGDDGCRGFRNTVPARAADGARHSTAAGRDRRTRSGGRQ